MSNHIKNFRMESILQQCRTKSTGSAKELAARYGVSERTIKRMFHTLKSEGYPVFFDRNSKSYGLAESEEAAGLSDVQLPDPGIEPHF